MLNLVSRRLHHVGLCGHKGYYTGSHKGIHCRGQGGLCGRLDRLDTLGRQVVRIQLKQGVVDIDGFIGIAINALLGPQILRTLGHLTIR